MKYYQSVLLITAGAMALIAARTNYRYPDVNREYIKHMFAMDTTYTNSARSRAIRSQKLVSLAHRAVTLTETITGLLCILGGLILPFHKAGRLIGLTGLTTGITLFFGGFRAIGGEYFQMWQSKEWNGLPDAERIAAIFGLFWLMLK